MRIPNSLLLLVVIGTISIISGRGIAQNGVPMLINYQGELRSPTAGEPIPDGSYEMLFRIYDVESGGTPLWEEVHSSLYDSAVGVTNGIFSVILGAGTGDPLDASILDGDERWLEIRVGTETLSPRQRMTSAAYSIISEDSHLLDGKEASDFADAAHTHSADDITSGVLPDEKIDPLVTRDSELSTEITTHAAVADVHHAKTTSFTELIDTATDAQIPDDITVAHSATAGDADTVDGMEGHALEESAEIDTAVSNHVAISGAHHTKTTSFSELTDAASDAQIPAAIARDSEVSTQIGNHTAIATAHHAKTTSFAELTDTPSDAQIPASIARDSEIIATVLGNDGNGSTLDADLLDGADSSDFAPSAHTHDAGDLASGTVDNGRFSAYADLSAEGYLDNDADEDLLTRSQTDGRYWALNGNSGTTPGTDFLGTADSQALELKVNNARAFRLEPNTTSPNLIAGYSGNNVTTGALGAVVGGGGKLNNENRVTDDLCTVGGGAWNVAGDDVGTTSDSPYATVGGGINNRAKGYGATAAGGSNNSANVTGSTVGGGESNTAGNGFATVGGGWSNFAAYAATVPGGWDNAAAGQYSLAAGRRAKANHQGTFVWADSQDTDVASGTNDEVTFRCRGGVRFLSGGGGANQMVSWTPGNASWLFSSDRNLKENFDAVDVKEVLKKLSQLSVTEWNFKGYSDRHIGPVAQEFEALFPLGGSETMIDSGDLQGVALAAIQGLHKIVQEKESRISTLEQRSVDLEDRLKALESLVGKLTDRQEQKRDGE